MFHKLFYIHNFHCCISLPTKEKNMPSFWKIIGSWFGASSESGSHTAPLANPPNPPAPPSPLIPTHRKKWYEQQRHNPRHNLPKAKSKQPFVAPPPPPPTNQETSPPPPHQSCPSSLPSASVAMNQEKNQKMPPKPPPPHKSFAFPESLTKKCVAAIIDNTIPTLDAGAKGAMQDYLKSRKRTRKDQHTIMPKEKPSLAYKGIHFKEAEPDRIIIHKIDAKCRMKGKVQVGAQLKGIDGNTSFSTLKEVDNLLSTIKINANHDLKRHRLAVNDVIVIASSTDDESTNIKTDEIDVIDIDSSTDENSVIDLRSTTDDES